MKETIHTDMNNISVTDVRAHIGDSAFLIDDGKTAILYDSGFGFTGDRIAENIKSVLGERKLDYIFLTHSHYDHALASANVLRMYPDAKVVAGSYAAAVFKREGAKRVMKELDSKFAAYNGITEYEFLGDELRVDIPCEDGDVIQAGDLKFEVLNLPGHTRCSVGFYCRKLRFFLATETLGVYDGNGGAIPSFLVGYQMALDSIDRVQGLDIRRALVPHYGLISEEDTGRYLKSMRPSTEAMAEEILSSIRAGKTDEEIVMEQVNKLRRGYIAEIYPIDAALLNTSIMVGLVRKELAGGEVK